jgi:hypothetical protein
MAICLTWLAELLDRRQQQPDQDRQDGDHDEEFDQREPAPVPGHEDTYGRPGRGRRDVTGRKTSHHRGPDRRAEACIVSRNQTSSANNGCASTRTFTYRSNRNGGIMSSA